VEATLTTVHLLLSKSLLALSNNRIGSEFALDEDDAKRLAEATANVLSYYNVKMTAKQQAYWELWNVAAEIYPPMFVTAYFNLREANQPQQRQKTAAPAAPRPMTNGTGQSAPQPTPATRMPTGFDPFHIKIPKETKQ
jgi:hypothetical protein